MEMWQYLLHCLTDLALLVSTLFKNGLHFLNLCIKSRATLSAEVLFLRKQLAYYQERKIPPRRFDKASRYLMVFLSRLFKWREALVAVKPKTLIGCHRAGFRLFWRWKSRRGRPQIPAELRALIRQMVRDNVSWGEERIANELRVKLGIPVSPRTVGKYIPKRPAGQPRGDQRWLTFIRNHTNTIVACDFLTVITATFKCLYVFIVIKLGKRELIHINVTGHPTAAWTLQQLREAILSDHDYRYLLHDRDSIFSIDLDASVEKYGLHVLRSPYRTPLANCNG